MPRGRGPRPCPARSADDRVTPHYANLAGLRPWPCARLRAGLAPGGGVPRAPGARAPGWSQLRTCGGLCARSREVWRRTSPRTAASARPRGRARACSSGFAPQSRSPSGATERPACAGLGGPPLSELPFGRAERPSRTSGPRKARIPASGRFRHRGPKSRIRPRRVAARTRLGWKVNICQKWRRRGYTWKRCWRAVLVAIQFWE